MTTIDRDAVTACLSARLGRTTVRTIQRTYPGNSRDTWIVDTAEHGGLVVRVDHPGGPLVPFPLETEYRVYEKLWPTPIPVPEPLFFGIGESFADGRAHMVRRLVPGSPRIEGLTGTAADDQGLRRAVCHEMAAKLALVHTLDWRGASLDEVLFVPASARTALADDLDRWRGIWADIRSDPFPMITEALFWLGENIPPHEARLSLLKGNNGIGEEIWQGTRIAALSDWELASIGHPALDWAFCQGLQTLHPLDDTLARYAQVAGFGIEPDLLAWATVWIRIKASMTTNGGMAAFTEGIDSRVVRPALGIHTVKSTERWLASALDRSPVELGRELIDRSRSAYLDGAHR